MAEQEGLKVVLRGPGEGDTIILPMGQEKAHITRKASRAETGGHWALGEAWQDPGFDNPPHTHDEAEAFYVLEGTYRRRASDQARSSLSHLAPSTGSEPVLRVGDSSASGHRPSKRCSLVTLS